MNGCTIDIQVEESPFQVDNFLANWSQTVKSLENYKPAPMVLSMDIICHMFFMHGLNKKKTIQAFAKSNKCTMRQARQFLYNTKKFELKQGYLEDVLKNEEAMVDLGKGTRPEIW